MTAGTVAVDGSDWSEASAIAEVLASRGVRSMFQPIVDLATGSVVAYEALARGPVGPMESPLALSSERPAAAACWPSSTRRAGRPRSGEPASSGSWNR
jgi:hypothetical protein